MKKKKEAEYFFFSVNVVRFGLKENEKGSNDETFCDVHKVPERDDDAGRVRWGGLWKNKYFISPFLLCSLQFCSGLKSELFM